MIGAELDIDAQQVLEEGYAHGLLLIKAREKVVRFVPPLVIKKKHIDELIEKFAKVLAEME